MDETFADVCRKLRTEAGLSMAKMSELTEIPIRTIEDWERGKRTPPSYVQKFVIEDLTKRKEVQNNEVCSI